MQGVVPHVPGPFAPQVLTHSACLSEQNGVGPVQSVCSKVVPSPQVAVRVAPSAPQAGKVVVVEVLVEAVVVVAVEDVVVGVVVVLTQTLPLHTPEQHSSLTPRQPWSPSGMQPTHIPTVVSQMDMEQLPHEPPQPSSPQFLFAQFGVQPHWLETPPPPQVLNPVQVLPQLSVKPVQSPSGIVPQSTPARQVVGVQQVPKSGFAFPGGEAGFMQLRLQQLMFV